MISQSQWFLKWLLPTIASALVGGLLLGTLYWAAANADQVAAARQKDLVTLIVSKMQASVAHDQESATVWDDAVIKTKAGDLEWLGTNLGQWMNTYFGHDAAVVLSPEGLLIYQFIAVSDNAPSADDLRESYLPLARRLRGRLSAADQEGVSDTVLSIGQSDLTYVGQRPAIVSVKPITSDTGEIEQRAGEENLHVAVRFLDGDFLTEIANEYQFAEMQFTVHEPQDKSHSQIPLKSASGRLIGFFNWHPFEPGLSVFYATLPVIGLSVLSIYGAASLAGRAIWKRSVRLASSRQELQHLALHDSLTGLANRAHFERELTSRLESALPQDNLGVLFVDLDRFKAVNDTYGHPTGDKLISLVALRLVDLLPNALIGRIGGDEFTVLAESYEFQEVGILAESIVKRLREPFDIDGAHVVVGASVGAALATGGLDAVELTRRADIALYHAKAAGRNTYAIFGDHMDDLLRKRRRLEHDLRAALERRAQIEIFYQPVYPANSVLPCSLEALSRWRHPELGLIPPDVFIPLAEEIGVIHEIGALVLEDACSMLADLPSIDVAINASAVELGSPGYPLRVLSTLAKWGVEPNRLEVEITESLAVSGEEQTTRNVEMLREAGVRLAIDDFGTGHSSFSRIQNIIVDRIKIDKSFIQDIAQRRSRAVVEAIITMARAQGLDTTAEGVETDEQRDALILLGCDNLQGFLLSRPISRGQVVALFSAGIRAPETARGGIGY
ncbi:EAL domain-containing protein [Neorhizobium galegae]|uniref:putative bifunctional diguanylate cyclase/phosphodiesterase n=1 Tax=Neorhizobium galegae TaxID=399 RepID=UPI00062248A3|nr:EAL domain-containing protein [Neorhizobium galegae]MCQ1775633.1 EAL domain-containing protein [Neorhizobium galegae]MCQ1798098.1 EAL domain-containing protein [Neorhizobium galegae]CDZ29114.1 Ggdef domain/eal domain protein [Neorhizobium galegae bv. officinalis]